MRKILALIMVAALVLSIAPMGVATVAYGATAWGGDDWKPGDVVSQIELPGDVFIVNEGSSTSKGIEWGVDFGTNLGPETHERNVPLWMIMNFQGSEFAAKTYGSGASGLREFERDFEVRTRMIRGGGVTKDARFRQGSSAGEGLNLQLRVEEEFTTIKEVEYRYEVFIIAKRDVKSLNVKKNQRMATISVEGEWEESRVVVTDDTYDYVYMADMRIIEPENYVRSVEIEADHDVWVYTRLYADRDIYLRVVNDEPKEEIHETHPSVLETIELKSIGLNNSYTTVTLKRDKNDWVYDSEWNFVGMGNAKNLAFSTIYYISTSELDVDTDLGEPDWTEGGDFEAETGGDDYLPNVNDNPGTGR